jgi:hypothetical protein
MKWNEQERRKEMPLTKMIFMTGIAAMTLIHLDSLAVAKSESQAAPAAIEQSTSDAPTGQSTFRVQPMLKDLPPGVAQTETKRTKAQIDFARNCKFVGIAECCVRHQNPTTNWSAVAPSKSVTRSPQSRIF